MRATEHGVACNVVGAIVNRLPPHQPPQAAAYLQDQRRPRRGALSLSPLSSSSSKPPSSMKLGVAAVVNHRQEPFSLLLCFVWSTDPSSLTRARIPTTTAEKWLSVKRVPCPLRPPGMWDRKRRQSWRST